MTKICWSIQCIITDKSSQFPTVILQMCISFYQAQGRAPTTLSVEEIFEYTTLRACSVKVGYIVVIIPNEL